MPTRPDNERGQVLVVVGVAFLALVAMAGSLYYSEVAGFIPCRLCWYQRILMYPLVAVTLVGALRRDDYLPGYVLPLSLLQQNLFFIKKKSLKPGLRKSMPMPGVHRL